MFNIFKKKKLEKRLSRKEYEFIEAIVNALSAKYPLFKKELDLNVFVYVASNTIGGPYSFVFGLDSKEWNKICDSSISNFDVKNIRFLDIEGQSFTVDLYISEGLIIGYTLPVAIDRVDTESIDVSNIWEKYFLNEDYTEIESIVSVLNKDQQNRLNMIKNTFRIEVEGVSYFPVHDIGNGNYLAVDKNGIVFSMTYDPFEIKKEYNTIGEMLKNHTD